MKQNPKFPLIIHYEDLPRRVGVEHSTLQHEQERQFWLNLLRDFIQVVIKLLRPFWLVLRLWGKKLSKSLRKSYKRLKHGEITIHLKWVFIGAVLLVVFYPHHPSKIVYDKIVSPVALLIKPIPKDPVKVPQTSVQPQQEVEAVAAVMHDLASNNIIANCGDNQYANFIYEHESGCNTGSTNAGGCFGIGQDCNGVLRSQCGLDYACQNQFFTRYANARYGGWYGSYLFWSAHSWW